MAGFQVPMDVVIKVRPPEAFKYACTGCKDTFVTKLVMNLSEYSQSLSFLNH